MPSSTEQAAADRAAAAAEALRRDQQSVEYRQLLVERAKRKAKRVVDAEEQPAHAAVTPLTVAELFARPQPQYVVDQWLPDAGLIQIVGQPGSLKTFFALDAALSIASAQPAFFGYPITQSGPVLYIAAEGGGAFQYRIRAWCQQRQVDPYALPFYVIPLPVNLRDEAAQQQLLAHVDALRPILIVVDTLSRCAPGAEENSAKDMGEVINFCTVLQQPSRAAVAFIHHPAKHSVSGGGRGSGVVFGAVDTEIQLSYTEDTDEAAQPSADGRVVTVTCAKQKDDQRPAQLELVGAVVPIVNDDGVELAHESGRAVTSLVLRAVDGSDAVAARRQREQDAERQLDVSVIETLLRYPAATTHAKLRAYAKVKNSELVASVGRLLRAEWVVPLPRGQGYAVTDLGRRQVEQQF